MSASRQLRWQPLGRWVLGGALAAVAPLSAVAIWWAQAPAPAADLPADQARYELLERQIERQPRDVRARVLKARLDVQSGRYELAATGFKQALDASPKVARDPGVWVEYAEAQALLQDGRLAGLPAVLIDRALALQADHPQALDLAGSADFEARDFTAAATHWRRLLNTLPVADPHRTELVAAIADAERRARLSLPPPR